MANYIELLVLRCAFGAYAVTFVTSFVFLLSQKKKIATLDFTCHLAFVLIMAVLVRDSSSQALPEAEHKSLITAVMGTCAACFMLGLFVGRSTLSPSSQPSGKMVDSLIPNVFSGDSPTEKSSIAAKVEILERKIKLKPRVDMQRATSDEHMHPSVSVSDIRDMGLDIAVDPDSKQDLDFKPPFADSSYSEIMEKSKAVVMSIVGLLHYPGSSEAYSKVQWTVIPSGSSANLWVSKVKTDGILLRATCLVNTPVKSVVKWILHNDLAMGIESLAFRKETLKTFKGGNTKLRRLSCKSGSITSSKRDVVAISTSACMPDGTHIISSRSLQVPDTITPVMRKPNKHGFIRGILYGSGFVLRPIRCIDTEGEDMCEIFVAVHMDMLGSASGRVNDLKREALADFVLQLLEHLSSGAANYFTAEDGDSVAFNDRLGQGGDSLSKSTSGATLSKQTVSGASGVPGVVDPTSPHAATIRALGLDQSQVKDILGSANDAVIHLRELYASKNSQQMTSISGPSAEGQLRAGQASEGSASARDANSSGTWETFYDSDGISVSEQSGSNRPVGTLNACCALEASPQTIRTLLLDHQDQIDGMLAGKSVLSKIDSQTYVQWLAYRSIWPLGARDFLLVTAEKPFSTPAGEGFLIVSKSIDEICEEIDEEEDEAGRDGKPSRFAEFSRSKLRLAGYIGVPSKTVPGGTDLSLFVDVDAYIYTPAWLVQVLAQYGLSEMMGRIRRATMGQSSTSQSSQLTTILSRIQSWESRLKLYRDEDSPQGAVDVGPIQGLPMLAPSMPSGASSPATNRLARMGRSAAKKPTAQSFLSDDESDNPSDIGSVSTPKVEDPVDVKDVVKAEDSSSASAVVAEVVKVRSSGQQLADFAILKMKKYLGIDPDASELGLEWSQKAAKGTVTVDASMVSGSTWQAIKGRMLMQAGKQKILDLLTNDNRIGEFDDMFDFFTFLVQIDECTVVRRVCFKGIWPTAPRDFVVCTTWFDLPDGSSMIVSRSAPDDYCAPQKGYVRGFIQVSGYWIQPVAGNNSECHVTLTAHTELGGTLPASMINMLSTSAPLKMLSTINDIVKR